MTRAEAERWTILCGLVRSTVHGLDVRDGVDDRDEMGIPSRHRGPPVAPIGVEPVEEALALWSPFEQFIYRTAAEREGRERARSKAGDLDLTILSLRKWMRLALKRTQPRDRCDRLAAPEPQTPRSR